MTLVRVTIELTDEQWAYVNEKARREQRSRSAVIRDLIDAGLKASPDLEASA